METKYILPATVAASLHLIALFGFNPPHVKRPATVTDVAPLKPFVVANVEPPPDSNDLPEPAAAQPKGKPEALHPEIEELPAKIADFTQPLLPPHPAPVVAANKIESGVPGVPDGIGDHWTNAPVLNFNALDNPPRTRSQVAPSYPADARRAGLAGEVVVEFVVDETGRVVRARVVRSSDTRFEAATLRAVEHWRFEPGKKDGRPVRFRMEAPVVYSLNG